MQPRKIYVNLDSRTITSGPDSPDLSGFSVFGEDVEAIQLYFFQKNTAGETQYQDYSANTVKLAIGLTQPAALLSSWTAISSTVTASITTLQTGGSGLNEIQRIDFSQTPQTGSFSVQFPSRNITVSSITASTCLSADHGLLNGQSVTLTGFSGISGFSNGDSFYVRDRATGAFKVATTPLGVAVGITATSGGTAVAAAVTTPLISAGASPSQVEAAVSAAGLVSSGQSQVGVTGTPAALTLSYAGVLANINMPTAAVVNSTLAGAVGLSGNLSLNTAEIEAILSAGTGGDCKLEVETFAGANRQTYQTNATVKADIISSASPSPLPANTANSFNLSDGAGGVWTVTIDSSGVLTASKV